MPRLHAPRALLAIVGVAALSLTAGCIPCLPGGGGGGGGGGCVNPTTVVLGQPETICLPETTSRVTLSFSPALAADTTVSVTCDAGPDRDLLVATANADNFSCGSWNSSPDDGHRVIPAGGDITFGVNQYATDPSAPGTAQITVTAVNP
jgi:hypothetical protein